MKTVTILDYGLSNLLSVKRAFACLGAEVSVADDPAGVLSADRLVLPGVGAFADGMQGLAARGLDRALLQKAAAGTPLLGICLGMQMLFDESDEFGLHKGLGLLAGRVEKIPERDCAGNLQRVPHVGWSRLQPGQAGFAGTVLGQLEPAQEMYFVHSFEAKPVKQGDVLAWAVYGGRKICGAVQKGKVIGCQFHPEKSGQPGLTILSRFLEQI